MKIQTVQCPKCKDIIYSRARHDYRYCSCGAIFVDGGLDYLRYGGDDNIEISVIDLDVTEKELYNDWNKFENKFGVIITKVEIIE